MEVQTKIQYHLFKLISCIILNMLNIFFVGRNFEKKVRWEITFNDKSKGFVPLYRNIILIILKVLGFFNQYFGNLTDSLDVEFRSVAKFQVNHSQHWLNVWWMSTLILRLLISSHIFQILLWGTPDKGRAHRSVAFIQPPRISEYISSNSLFLFLYSLHSAVWPQSVNNQAWIRRFSDGGHEHRSTWLG